MLSRMLMTADWWLYKTRYVLTIASLGMVLLLGMTHRMEAYCSLNSCSYSEHESSCFGTPCGHWSQTNAYFDPSCSLTACCLQGPCYLEDRIEGGACQYCASGDIAFCGYGAGC